MSDAKTIGERLKLLRGERAMTRNELAEESGVGADVIEKLEHGRRQTARATWLMKLAGALRTEPSTLLGRPRPGSAAVCEAVAEPESTPGMDADDAGEAPDLGELRTAVAEAWRGYLAGDLARVATTLPGLIGEARLASLDLGAKAAAPLAEVHHLAARLLSRLGRADLAALATDQAIRTAEGGDDELHWTALHGAYSSALLQQGRTRISEDHAVRIAEHNEPSPGDAELRRLTVWGGLVFAAMAAAVTGARTGAVGDYVGLARAATGRFDRDRLDYHVRFGPSEVAMRATHAYALLHEPGLALQSAGGVHPEDLPRGVYGRHLLDVARAQEELRDLREAEVTLREADSLSHRSFGQPIDQSLLIGPGRLPKAQRLPDLRTVVLDRPSRPPVLREQLRIDPHLPGHIVHRGLGDLPGMPRKPGLDLEELQQQAETQARRAGLVAHQPPVAVQQRPRGDQIFRLPLPTHPRAPFARSDPPRMRTTIERPARPTA